MNRVPDDVIMYMALVMDIPAVLKFCNSSPRFNRIICNNQKYWMNKLLNDFPEDFDQETIWRYGPDFKRYYRSYAYNTIKINVVIDQYNEYAGEYEYIYADADLIFRRNSDIKKLLFDVILELFNSIDAWGQYTIYIDDNGECLDTSLEKECFDNVDVNTKSITVNFASKDFIDETDAELTEILRQSIENVKRDTQG